MEKDWKQIKINGIVAINKVVGEFIIEEHTHTPYGKFRVKIIERNGVYIGYTNLLIKDEEGYPSSESGIGSSIEEVLEKTIRIFVKQLEIKFKIKGEDLDESDFEYADSFDF